MNAGKIVQLGIAAGDLRAARRIRFVADFIGTSTFLRGQVVRAGPGSGPLVIKLADGSEITATAGRNLRERATVTVAIRPEKLRIQATPEPAGDGRGTVLPARVATRSYLGARWQYQLAVADIIAKVESEDEFEEEVDVWLWIPNHGCAVFETDDAIAEPVPAERVLAAAAIS